MITRTGEEIQLVALGIHISRELKGVVDGKAVFTAPKCHMDVYAVGLETEQCVLTEQVEIVLGACPLEMQQDLLSSEPAYVKAFEYRMSDAYHVALEAYVESTRATN